MTGGEATVARWTSYFQRTQRDGDDDNDADAGDDENDDKRASLKLKTFQILFAFVGINEMGLD